MSLVHLLVSGKTLSERLEQRANEQEAIGLVSHIFANALAGAGHLGCVGQPESVVNMLNLDWQGLGSLGLGPAIEIVSDPQSSAEFADINNLAAGSQALVVRGFAQPLARLNQPLDEHRGEGWLYDSRSRINSGDVVLISDCQQGALFSATSTWHSQGRVRFSWAVGDGELDNAPAGQAMDGTPVPGGLDQLGAGFAEDAGLWGPTGSRLYVARSGVIGAGSNVWGLWQKSAVGNPLELVTGVEDLQLRYGAWRSHGGGQMGYFDAAHLPVDARVVLLSVRFFLAAVEEATDGAPVRRPVEIAIPVNAVTAL